MRSASCTSAVLVGLLLLGCGEMAPISLVIVTLDTTRVDHLSVYGYERETTPQLEAFAERAVRFERAWSTSTWTLPAHASLFTGLYPASHGAHYDARGAAALGSVLVSVPAAKLVRAGRLDERTITLAEILSARGYETGAFVGGPWLHRSFGLLQGVEKMDDESRTFGGRDASLLTDRALEWLEDLEADAPYFLFLNYFDAHAPYNPPPGYDDLPRAQDSFEPPYKALMTGAHTLTSLERSILVDRYD